MIKTTTTVAFAKNPKTEEAGLGVVGLTEAVAFGETTSNFVESGLGLGPGVKVGVEVEVRVGVFCGETGAVISEPISVFGLASTIWVLSPFETIWAFQTVS